MTDAYIIAYKRTAFARYAGALASTRPDDLAAIPIRALVAAYPEIDPEDIDDIYLGCANQAGEDNRNVARMASLLAGVPESVPAATVNRLCGSGMDAIIMAARAVASGDMELALAGGVESMTRAPFVMPKTSAPFSRNTEIFDTTIGWRFVNPVFNERYGTDTMPGTAENVAWEYEIDRAAQDGFAVRSQQKAAAAQSSGRLAEEIVAVETVQKKEITTFETDEHLRPDTTIEKLSKLPAPFAEDGTVTAGNASGINDGAAALMIASEKAVMWLGAKPLARIIGAAHAGVSPRIMGIGPIDATQRLCRKIDKEVRDFDVFEINEAFAAQSLAVTRSLGLADDAPNVNPNGGAIALGHPLGATGARITGTAAMELSKGNGNLALATMCIGVGQGVAIALEAC